MPNVKEDIIRMVQNMPEGVSVEDVMTELYFSCQVDEGLKELDSGKGISHREVEKLMVKWIEK